MRHRGAIHSTRETYLAEPSPNCLEIRDRSREKIGMLGREGMRNRTLQMFDDRFLLCYYVSISFKRTCVVGTDTRKKLLYTERVIATRHRVPLLKGKKR